MINIYKSTELGLKKIQEITDGAWVNVINPSEEEINFIVSSLNVDTDFIRAALDEEERPRIEIDAYTENKLIIVDTPIVGEERNSKIYETIPLAIISTKMALVTICLKENNVIDGFLENHVKTFFTFKKYRFILQILYRNASLYLQYLKQIDKQSSIIENELHKSMKNKELIQLLTIEKSLVYFSTSLKSNELVMEKLMKYDFIKHYEEDKELLEDTIIENKQAIEMAKIYSDILSGTMDAFASVISNNLNIVMKVLTSITIVMAIPTIIASFFGMNVPVPFTDNRLAFPCIMAGSIIICFLATKIMANKNMFIAYILIKGIISPFALRQKALL